MTTDTDAKLLPCPFCGGDAAIMNIEGGENAGGSCVSCTKCLASSNVEFEFKENFVLNWNSRITPSPVPADEKLCDCCNSSVNTLHKRQFNGRNTWACKDCLKTVFGENPDEKIAEIEAIQKTLSSVAGCLRVGTAPHRKDWLAENVGGYAQNIQGAADKLTYLLERLRGVSK